MLNRSGRVSMWAARLVALVVLTSCGGGGDGGGGGAQSYSVSGTVTAVANASVDSDVNDPNAPYASNDSYAQAQTLPNPVVVGGFVSAAGTGVTGGRFADSGDVNDVYTVTLAAGQTMNLYIGNYDSVNPTAVDLDLGLIDNIGTLAPVLSTGTGPTESLTVAIAGTYQLVVEAAAGISTYTLTIGAAPLAAGAQDLNSASDFVPGEVIVRFKDHALSASTTGSGLQARAASLGLRAKAGGVGRPMLLSLGSGSARMQALAGLGVNARLIAGSMAKTSDPVLKDKLETQLAVKALRTRADVASADLNYIRKAFMVPNDAGYVYQWHYPLINLPQAWDITTGNGNVVVAVIDSGVFMAHPDLVANLTNTGYDFISGVSNANDGDGIDANPDDPGDSSIAGQSSWHGTHVAGTIAAGSNNALGVAGVSWSNKVMPLRALGKSGGGSSYDIQQAVRYAAGLSNDSGTTPAQRADVINLSLGGPSASQAEQDTYTAARNAGVIVIAAAGNDNTSQLSYPASYEGVVSVSAVDMNKNKAPYSNFGAMVDVTAPGGDTSVDRNGDGYPDGVLSTLVSDSSGTRQPNFGFYNGTSMAAPHVAGVAGLMVAVRKAAGSTLTPAEFDTFLSNGNLTTDLGAAGRDDIFGHGLIDAFKAVQAASSVAPTALILNPSTLNFDIVSAANAARTLTVSTSGTGSLAVTATATSASWLTLTPSSVDGSGLGTYTASVTKGALPDGIYSGTITFTTDAATTVKVNVSMKIGSAISGSGNTGHLYALLVDTVTFETLNMAELVPSAGQYSYSFSGVAPGTYYIFAGSDMDNDDLVCDEGESCGAYPTLTPPSIVTVSGSVQGINFTAGFDAGIGANAAGARAGVAAGLSRRVPGQKGGH